MKVYLIKASAPGAFKEYKKYMGAPPQNIFAAAAATPNDIELEATDETVDMKVNYRSDADIVAIFMSTPDAIRGYEIAKKFKEKNKLIVFGGLHATFLPDEALQYGDVVLVGEIEEIWEEMLRDYENGQLREKYERTEPFDLANLKPYPTNLIDKKYYDDVWSVVVGRGCAYKCSFCTVHRFFGSMRFRPIEQIVEEIKNSGAEWIELHSDNLLVNRTYAVELFQALKPLNINWMGETSINLAKDDELLQLAVDSGLKYLLLGLETPSQEALKEAGKGFVKVNEVKEFVEKLRNYGVIVDSSFLFGFDEHDQTIFEATFDYAKEIGIDSVHSVILIPFPGTTTYAKFEREGRILTKDWSKYDGVHVVFEPRNMTVKELENGAYWFHRRAAKLMKRWSEIEGYGMNTSTKFKWKTIIALILLSVAVVMNWSWVWGILFIFWVTFDLINQETYFVERITRAENLVLYWIIVAAWIILSVFSFIPASAW